MQNGNIGVLFQRSQGQRGLYTSMFLSSWRDGFMEYVKTLKIHFSTVCHCSYMVTRIFADCIKFSSRGFFFFFFSPLWCCVDPLLRIWQSRDSESVHLDLVRGVVKTGLLGAGLSQHTTLMFFSTPLKAPSPLLFAAQMLL